jgi:hypothetical protein
MCCLVAVKRAALADTNGDGHFTFESLCLQNRIAYRKCQDPQDSEGGDKQWQGAGPSVPYAYLTHVILNDVHMATETHGIHAFDFSLFRVIPWLFNRILA